MAQNILVHILMQPMRVLIRQAQQDTLLQSNKAIALAIDNEGVLAHL